MRLKRSAKVQSAAEISSRAVARAPSAMFAAPADSSMTSCAMPRAVTVLEMQYGNAAMICSMKAVSSPAHVYGASPWLFDHAYM